LRNEIGTASAYGAGLARSHRSWIAAFGLPGGVHQASTISTEGEGPVVACSEGLRASRAASVAVRANRPAAWRMACRFPPQVMKMRRAPYPS